MAVIVAQVVIEVPFVLAADLGTKGLAKELIVGPSVPQIRKAGEIDIPALRASSVKPAGEPLTFEMNGTELKPISRILDRRYSVYFKAV